MYWTTFHWLTMQEEKWFNFCNISLASLINVWADLQYLLRCCVILNWLKSKMPEIDTQNKIFTFFYFMWVQNKINMEILTVLRIDSHWRIEGAYPAHAPRVQILSFRHTKCSKHNHLGSQHHPPYEVDAPYGKSWIRHCFRRLIPVLKR